MKVLVTGANGFVGKYLCRELRENNFKVFAGVRSSTKSLGNGVEQVYLDLFKDDSIKEALKSVLPDAVIHLAAQSNVRDSWNRPVNTANLNIIGTLKLLEHMEHINPNPSFFYIGSGEEYGISAKSHSVLNEDIPCKPQNPYATSKFATGQILLQIAKKSQLNIVYFRPFNHFGPGQQKGFVISDFASQIAAIEKGYAPNKIFVGNLDTARDFTDVRDVVRAYRLALENDLKSSIYNISSGVPRSISCILERLINFSYDSIDVVIDEEKFRVVDVPSISGDSTKLKAATGWEPIYNFDASLKETLNWWREKIK